MNIQISQRTISVENKYHKEFRTSMHVHALIVYFCT